MNSGVPKQGKNRRKKEWDERARKEKRKGRQKERTQKAEWWWRGSKDQKGRREQGERPVCFCLCVVLVHPPSASFLDCWPRTLCAWVEDRCVESPRSPMMMSPVEPLMKMFSHFKSRWMILAKEPEERRQTQSKTKKWRKRNEKEREPDCKRNCRRRRDGGRRDEGWGRRKVSWMTNRKNTYGGECAWRYLSPSKICRHQLQQEQDPTGRNRESRKKTRSATVDQLQFPFFLFSKELLCLQKGERDKPFHDFEFYSMQSVDILFQGARSEISVVNTIVRVRRERKQRQQHRGRQKKNAIKHRRKARWQRFSRKTTASVVMLLIFSDSFAPLCFRPFPAWSSFAQTSKKLMMCSCFRVFSNSVSPRNRFFSRWGSFFKLTWSQGKTSRHKLFIDKQKTKKERKRDIQNSKQLHVLFLCHKPRKLIYKHRCPTFLETEQSKGENGIKKERTVGEMATHPRFCPINEKSRGKRMIWSAKENLTRR